MRWFAGTVCAACLTAGAVFAQQFDSFDSSPLFDGIQLGPNDGLGNDNGTAQGFGDDIRDALQDAATPLFPGTDTPVTSVIEPNTIQAQGAVLRALDKIVGRPADIELRLGEAVLFGRIAIRLLECRAPMDDPASDAFAHIQAFDLNGETLFDGWMIASSPSLNALEHPRYDVWVLSCGEGGE